jgi:hypothetical protein
MAAGDLNNIASNSGSLPDYHHIPYCNVWTPWFEKKSWLFLLSLSVIAAVIVLG